MRASPIRHKTQNGVGSVGSVGFRPVARFKTEQESRDIVSEVSDLSDLHSRFWLRFVLARVARQRNRIPEEVIESEVPIETQEVVGTS